MFTLPKISVPSFLRVGANNYPKVDLSSVEIHDIETAAERRPRTLKHLLKANHANYSVLYHDLRFHNHAPHILGSTYILGGTAEHLNEIYEKEAEELEPWKDSPGEISKDDWRDFLGKKEYQRAFIDFFEDQLVSNRYNLQELLDEYLLGGKEPLVNGLISGLAHPLIHLGYAYELDSKTVAIEALALAACVYSPLHKYINNPKYTKPSLVGEIDGHRTDLLDILSKVRGDKRFDGLYDRGSGDITKVLEEREEAFLEYWNQWKITSPTEQFEETQSVAVAILMETAPSDENKFDFFFVHVLTSSHAIRILLPLIPAKFHINLLRQWWLFTLAVYIAQTRPEIRHGSMEGYDVKGRNWKHVVHKALDGPHSKDAHYVKSLRSLKVCAETWGDENQYYVKAAIKFADEFDHWGGFGTEEDAAELAYPIRHSRTTTTTTTTTTTPKGALKKALNKLKTGHHSNPASDDEAGSKTPTTTTTTTTGAAAAVTSPANANANPNGVQAPQSPAAAPRSSGIFSHRASGDYKRSDISSPTESRSSIDQPRHSLTGLLSRRTDSPNRASANAGGSHHRSGSLSTHSPIRAVKEKLHIGGDNSSSDDNLPLNREGEPMSKNQLRKHEKQAQQEERYKQNMEKEKLLERRRKEMDEQAEAELTPEQKAKYGSIHPNAYAGEWKHEPRMKIQDFSARDVGKEVVFRARIHHLRKMSSKFVFFMFRQQLATIQGVLMEHADISKYMLYWAEHLDAETVVLVKGILQEPKAKQGEVLGATIHDVEVSVHAMHVEAAVTENLPFNVNEAEVSQADVDAELAREDHREGHNRVKISDRTRLTNRVIDLRTTASQGIFRIQSGICNLFRTQLDSEGFIEIHTPKLQGGATESGASVFKIDYFGRGAFLAQSPQLAKQMAISADFGKVYEIGAVFRAENSNTYRHLTEYTGLDLEMQIDEHYHEVLRVLDRTFKAIFKGVYERYRPEIEIIKKHFPHEDLVWLDETPVLPFAQAVRMLNESGWRDDEGNPLDENEDLGTRDEVQLGRVIKQKLGTDYYILDKFPVNARPFYAMPDPNDPKVTNSFDIFCRGQEILSGGQRIHDADMLLEKMRKLKVDPQTMEEYIQGFQWGAPPHGGGGIGLERILMLMMSLGNIRHASMFPRDPKSLPEKPIIKQLRHPEASTMHPPWEGQDRVMAKIDFQPVEKLIANYGDATNTSWLEPRTEIWRDDNTGAAVGFVPQDGFAITVGDPLCHQSQYLKTMTAYLKYIKKERNLKPLWLLVGAPVEETLATKFNWRTFSVTGEQRVDPVHNPAEKDSDVQRKIRHAEKEGVKISDYALGSPPPAEIKQKVDARVEDWLKNRKGKQVHLTNIHPWQDEEHRQYHIAYTSDGTIAAFVAMAQLSPDHGWQVKYSLDFPGAPGGSIEYIVTHALKMVGAGGATTVTFGGGASSKFTPGHNVKGTRVKVLSRAYHAIATELKLTNKTEFREKLGAIDDPSYICYPPHGLGPLAVKAILNFFSDEDDN